MGRTGNLKKESGGGSSTANHGALKEKICMCV